jgi:hypothetical protein
MARAVEAGDGSVLQRVLGHEWLLGSEIEALSPEEMQRRYTAMLTG